MRCIVTGGAGFIGSHLTELLLNEGHAVVAIDNLAVGRRRNLRSVWDHPRFRFVHLDIAECEDVVPAFDGADWVFHLGALAGVVPSVQHPLGYHRANVDGTAIVLEAARAVRVKRFIYAASSTCYGVSETFPTAETAPLRPINPHALSKYVAEQYVMHWSGLYDMPALSLRLFSVYGPRTRISGTHASVCGVFLAQKLAGTPYTIVGDGNQTRDFTYVDDVVRALLLAAQSDLAGEALNVGAGVPRSVNDLARLLGGPVQYIPERPLEPSHTFADITKIKQTLGWAPQIGFDDGVARMLDHLEEWRERP